MITNNDVEEQIKNLKLSRNFIVVYPNPDNWYRLLDIITDLKGDGHSIVLLDRYSADVSVIPEKEMNKLGWFKHEN